jgi:predicted metal-dependent peptidase
MCDVDTLQRVKDGILWLTARVPFLGYLALRLRPRLALPHDRVTTAAVAADGTLVIDEAFCAGLRDEELRFVLCHEVLHPALDYWGRLGSRDPRLFNEAHDHAINLLLTEFADRQPGIAMPEGLLDGRHARMSAEEIYDTLVREREAGTGSRPGGPGPGSRLAGDCRGELAIALEGQDAARGDQSACGRLSREWRIQLEAARQVHESTLGRGTMPRGMLLILEDMLAPRVAWTSVLSEWLGERAGVLDYAWTRPARRSESAGEFLPALVRRSFPDVTVLWDTSGSHVDEAGAILGEVAAIVEELGLSVRLIVCDAAVHADVEGLERVEDAIPHVRGGGGSDFCPAFERLQAEANTSVVVAFTDGAITVPAEAPESLQGVLWVLPAHGFRPASWGRAIRVRGDDSAEEL